MEQPPLKIDPLCTGDTSLMSAGSVEMVKILLEGGADVNARNNQGKEGCEKS